MYYCQILTAVTKILFITPYPLQEAPSQRFRFEQYFDILTESIFHFTVHPFLPSDRSEVLYKRGNNPQKIILLISGFANRIKTLSKIRQYDFIFIHREATPIGPPAIEWLIAKVFRKKIIYDFDDAIWLTDKKNESWLEKKLRWRSKVGLICKWSYKVSCGNEYLCSYARKFNNNVVLNPTTIDTEKAHNRIFFTTSLPSTEQQEKKTVIGWTGSSSTLKYLEELGPVLQQLLEKYPSIVILIIADRPPQMKLDRLVFKQWARETEIKDLCQVDIGIMPLPDDEWSKGKCGFKALQYMALEIPAVVSPVAVNKNIVTPGVHGFWCESQLEWVGRLSQLIEDPALRKEMGSNGRKKVVKEYSVFSNKENFLSLFR